MIPDLDYALKHARWLGAEEARLRQIALLSGAMESEFKIVMRLDRLPGKGFVDSMRMDYA